MFVETECDGARGTSLNLTHTAYFLCFQLSSHPSRSRGIFSELFRDLRMLTHYWRSLITRSHHVTQSMTQIWIPSLDIMSSCAWDGLNFCPISGMLWDGVQVVLAVWLQSPSLRVTSNDVGNMRCRAPLRLSASADKTRAMLRGWEALTVCHPGSGVEKINLDCDTGDETQRVRDRCNVAQTQADTVTRHVTLSQISAGPVTSFLSSSSENIPRLRDGWLI